MSLQIAGKNFGSRLMVGTGKFADFETMKKAHAAIKVRIFGRMSTNVAEMAKPNAFKCRTFRSISGSNTIRSMVYNARIRQI